jgi:hypothetical protein
MAAGCAKFPDLNGDCAGQPGQGAMGLHQLTGGLIGVEYSVFQPSSNGLPLQPRAPQATRPAASLLAAWLLVGRIACD